MTNGFGPQDYTADGMLRVGWLLWLILAFLARHWILLGLGAVSSFVGVRSAPNAGATPDLLSGPWFLLASLPALALLAAALRRRPAAGPLVRGLWRHGRWLLLAGILVGLSPFYVRRVPGLHVGLLVLGLGDRGDEDPLPFGFDPATAHLVVPIAAFRLAAVDHVVVKQVVMPRALPDLGMHDDGAVESDHFIAVGGPGGDV